MSGHSKWANIKNGKGAQDKKRSETFTKMSRNILAVLRSGGNVKAIIEKAREVNMPKENIERLIEKFESRKMNLQNFMFEGFGPHSVPMMVEVESDNKNRILGEVRLIFKNNGGSLGEEGSVGYLFDRVGEIELSQLNEEQELVLIDLGAIDFEDTTAVCEVANLSLLSKKIIDMGWEIISSKIVMRAKSPVVLNSDQELSDILEMIDELEENDDVVAVFAGFDYHE